METLCKGLCKGDRSSAEGPAIYGHLSDGTKVLWCPCCDTALALVGVEPQAPNLTAEGRQEFVATRFECLACAYYQVTLSKGPTSVGTRRSLS